MPSSMTLVMWVICRMWTDEQTPSYYRRTRNRGESVPMDGSAALQRQILLRCFSHQHQIRAHGVALCQRVSVTCYWLIDAKGLAPTTETVSNMLDS